MTTMTETKATVDKPAESSLQQYLQEVRQFPLLRPEQERELAIRCTQGNLDAMRQMVNCNLRLVVSIAREYQGKGVPLMDLIQEGNIGLLIAVQKFDYQREVRFSTYATKWIRQGITRCLMNHAGIIRVPAHTSERMRRVMAARNQYRQETGEEPSLEQLSQATQLPAPRVAQLLKLIPETCSLDAPTGEEAEGTLGQLLADPNAQKPESELVREQLSQALSRLLDGLTPRQQQILRLHYGLEDDTCHSLEEIARRLGISKERVRQVEQQALARAHTQANDMGLADFLEDI